MKFKVLSGEEDGTLAQDGFFAQVNELMDTAQVVRVIQEAYHRLPAKVKQDIKAERLKRNALTLPTRRNQ